MRRRAVPPACETHVASACHSKPMTLLTDGDRARQSP
jgi:hypothetical protein